jgi:Leucine-rich repeat (LRR) protein
LKKLLTIKENIFWLDLSDIGMEDGDMGLVGGFVHIQKLQLQRNRISSTGIKSLVTLKQLTYLNVHSNNLDDTAVSAFEQLPNLQKVILWNNRLSPAIIDRLRTRTKPVFITGG